MTIRKIPGYSQYSDYAVLKEYRRYAVLKENPPAKLVEELAKRLERRL